MASPTTQISLSSVLKRTGKSIETALSVVDILSDGIDIATNYTSRIKEEQVKEQAQKAIEFDNNLALRKVAAENEFIAGKYQLGSKARQLENLPEFEENMEACNKLLR